MGSVALRLKLLVFFRRLSRGESSRETAASSAWAVDRTAYLIQERQENEAKMMMPMSPAGSFDAQIGTSRVHRIARL